MCTETLEPEFVLVGDARLSDAVMLLSLSEPIKVRTEAAGKLTDHRRVVVEVGRILTERDALTGAACQPHDPPGTPSAEVGG